MKKLILIPILTVLLLLLAACQPSIDQAKANYCESLGNFAEAIANVRQIDENSTVDELKQAQQAVGEAWSALANSAGNLADAQFNEMEQAYRELERTVNDIPDDATVAEALEAVRLASLNTLAQYADIASTTCVYGQQ